METRHVRIDLDIGRESKKNILQSEMNLLEMLKRVKTYRSLRKKELTLKKELKEHVSVLKTKLHSFELSLPESPRTVEEKKSQKHIGVHATRDIHRELEEIKQKLAQLG